MKKKYFFILVLLFTSKSFCQLTHPTAFNLAEGDYSLTEWSADNPAVTYPPNMIFHQSNVTDPGLEVEMTTDYTSAYNLTTGTRINGLGVKGFSFINTSTAGYLGAVVLALNTVGRVNISVSWIGRTITPNSREYAIQLQYRIGTAGQWVNLDANYKRNTTKGHFTLFSDIFLPEEAENQDYVQLRWKYYYISGGGTRPELGIDDILVTSVPVGRVPPRVRTLSINDITYNSCFVQGEVIREGASAVIERGFCWAETFDPTINDNKIVAGSGLGAFGAKVMGLAQYKEYYIRAYAMNLEGTSYGANVYFKTLMEPFDLSVANYSFTSWSSFAEQGTYPPNMIFRQYMNTLDATINDESDSDWTLPYNLTSGSRINGLNEDGISFLNTSSKNEKGGYVGDVVLCLNTLNKRNIDVFWLGGFLGLSGTSTRDYRIILQYRNGAEGGFQNVLDEQGEVVEFKYPDYLGVEDYKNIPIYSKNFIVRLPETCENKPYIQLRWKYYCYYNGGNGVRPRLRLDDIYIGSDLLDVKCEAPRSNYLDVLKIYPNPVDDFAYLKIFNPEEQVVKISVINNLGQFLGIVYEDFMQSGLNCIKIDLGEFNLGAGIYFFKLESGSGAIFEKIIMK